MARRRRNVTQAMLAERLGTSVMTVHRMEDGCPGTALQYLARALQVCGELETLNVLLDSAHDRYRQSKRPLRERLLRAAAGATGDGTRSEAEPRAGQPS